MFPLGYTAQIKKERLIKVFQSIQPEDKMNQKEICMELAISVLLLARSIIDNLEQRTLTQNDLQILFQQIFGFIIKFGYNARCHWLKERAL